MDVNHGQLARSEENALNSERCCFTVNVEYSIDNQNEQSVYFEKTTIQKQSKH